MSPDPFAAKGLQTEPGDAKAVANYAAELTGDLADMARRQGLDTLAYILEMAKLEAENIARGTKRPSQR